MTRSTIFLSLSGSYWPHAAVAVSTLLDHNADCDVHVFSDTRGDRWIPRLTRKARSKSSSVTFHHFDSSLASGLKECGHLGLSTYYRLFVPELFVHDVDRLLYIDADMVVRGSIDELYRHDLGGHVLGAVPGFSRTSNLSHALRLAHGVDSPYFNAGLLLIDTRRWCDSAIKEQCLAFLRDHPERVWYADQDLLNYCLAGRYQYLSCGWNVMVDHFRADDPADLDELSPEELDAARIDPRILHFNGQYKPWHLTYSHPFKSSYLSARRQLQRTPYISDDFPWAVGAKVLSRLSRLIKPA